MIPNTKRDLVAIEYLQQNVYPGLQPALMKLIDHVVKSDEVRKHQERLKKIKIFDKIEQKRVEKERLKAELGSEYESSEGSVDLDEMGINQSEFHKYMSKDQKEIQSPLPMDEQAQQGGVEEQTSQELKKDTLLSLGEIREDQEDEDQADKHELEKMKQYLRQQREEMSFNPLLFLAQQIRDMIAANN
ncbi:unnamed protein product (macronuclear) [Paramecium tetraurelia]|uniref:Uncharacterized protein n=1 Tax=Paramecium tetraurelia TaxID=5888 RepID=A0DA93_PARTE|nr:uncharacterized protein GSPATT00014867001 [Paramecium tetraurelia]CAK79960.1 unnamed protein product [Paramecium tetraurelia]|eukprot:XP_001447357.1 hypothetical protein (macronuclear) [Paramecium tetraurelia strain d4-2]